MALGKAIEQARRERGWTQVQLGATAGVPAKTINALEKRDSHRSVFAQALAAALDLSLPDLLDGRAVRLDNGSKVAAAIKAESALDGIALIERGLAALLIVGKTKDAIMAQVAEAARDSAEVQAAVMQQIREKVS